MPKEMEMEMKKKMKGKMKMKGKKDIGKYGDYGEYVHDPKAHMKMMKKMKMGEYK